MTYALSTKSQDRLKGVHPRLVAVVKLAITLSEVDFAVLEGVRTVERQKELLAAGASQTMRSRHLTGHAVDLGAIVGGQVRWDWPLYDKIAVAVKAAAKQLSTPIEWGGDWTSLKDGPHFQLAWRDYP
ncbi:L-Ala-D-Glu_peptidase_like domain containing protein [Comamonadaceae bacterium]